MQQKMVRFLSSIGIISIDRFDIDFDLVSWNPYNNKQVDMAVVKVNPWEYSLLEEFQNGLTKISYPYSISFSYINKPTVYDALHLFDSWYISIYHKASPFRLESDEDTILFVFVSQDELDKYKSVIEDFKDFLLFLNYHFSVTSLIKAKTEKVEISKSKMTKITKEATKAVVIEKTNEVSYYNEPKSIEEVHKEQLKETEKTLIEEMLENKRKLEEDKAHKKIFKKGDYVIIDSLRQLDSNSGNIDFIGKVFEYDLRTSNYGKVLNIGVGDNYSAIYVKIKENKALSFELMNTIKIGMNVRVKGAVDIDKFSHDLYVFAHIVDTLPPDEPRTDNETQKRVELHLHTKMSSMDGVAEIVDYINTAKTMGHKAIALTDHGVVQAFPDAQKASKKAGVKMLYGSELYMVDDKLNAIRNPSPVLLKDATYVVFDLETTGLSRKYCRVVEFGGLRFEKGMIVETLDFLINPQMNMPKKVADITHISDDMLKGKPTFTEVYASLRKFIPEDAIFISHNADFDIGFLNAECLRNGLKTFDNPVIDTLALSRYLFPSARKHTLGALATNMEITTYNEEEAHRADFDAKVLNDIWQAILSNLTKKNPLLKHKDLEDFKVEAALLKHLRAKHVCVLCKNNAGLKDLYKLVSLSHIEYLADVPKTPRSELERLRKNLLIGSACFNGEIFDYARTKDKASLQEAMKFYDYIEIQPKTNYSYLINSGQIEDDKELERYILDIIEAADELHIPVVATSDAHYVNKEDKIFRDVYILAKGVGGKPHPLNTNPYERPDQPIYENPDQYYRSTREMLDEFKFLKDEKAFEIVVTNTNKIADSIEPIIPIKDDLFTPTIKDSEKLLKEICYKTAHEWYGDNLPKEIEERLSLELNGIINNGYSVIYYIAHKIIKKANDDGFMVGSRGSVGSSFVATMSGITEVNPLAPHYRCPKCKHFEFSNDPQITSGFDLPEKQCPVCGEKMIHDGQNIPFATFLGFNADKVPDIDLNFGADYQSRAHDYTKVLLGADNVFRAGTIETVADKTAYGYARGYFERMGKDINKVPKAEIAKLAAYCTGVKRTTGQHPGGIVVIPKDYEVYDFTPVQYPADDNESSWKTTHFDFHAIHDTVLKLDLLGHVDPMALKMMSELTNKEINTIPLNDAKVLSIFSSTKALEMKHNYLQLETGALAIPEFGTDFVQGMLEKTRPKSFSDLLIISGLSHGTDVWNGNADKLIEGGIADLRGVIGCRDDIMTYLIKMGVPPIVSFSIMEDVRHGKKLKTEFTDVMKAHNVPQYYIDSCNKIQYLFPKAHATAYVMMGVRVGYFKVYYPLEFYATYFSVRSKQYDIVSMINGEDAIIDRIEEIKRKRLNKLEKVSPKEEEILKTLSIAIEMVERGYKFENIDLYKSDAKNFVVDHEKNGLIPPFLVIDGLGESAALSVIEARKNGKFLSKQDLLKRTKLNGTNMKILEDMNVLSDLGESDQCSIFEFNYGDDV